jgi:hypothetical protein
VVVYGTVAEYRSLASCLLGFGTCDVWGEVVSHLPKSQPELVGLCVCDPQRWGGTRYNPRHWVVWYLAGATSSAENNRKLQIGCC